MLFSPCQPAVIELGGACVSAEGMHCQKFVAMFVWTYQQNQQSSSSVFLSQQTSEQCFQHNKPVKRTGCVTVNSRAGSVPNFFAK
jgi:hypothetical protein